MKGDPILNYFMFNVLAAMWMGRLLWSSKSEGFNKLKPFISSKILDSESNLIRSIALETVSLMNEPSQMLSSIMGIRANRNQSFKIIGRIS